MYNLLEYSPNYSDTTVYGFILKMKQLTLMLIVQLMIKTSNLLKYKTKLIGRTAASNGILKNATTPSRHTASRGRPLKVP